MRNLALIWLMDHWTGILAFGSSLYAAWRAHIAPKKATKAIADANPQITDPLNKETHN